MKNYLSILFAAFILIISSPSLKASGLDFFAVTDPVGKNGLIIYNFSAPTKFKFEVMFHAETDSYNNILDPKMTFVLVYVKDGIVEEISNEISIPLSSYKQPFIKTDFLKFEAVLPANRQGGVIRIRYSYNTNFPKGQEQPNRVTFYNPSGVDCPVPTLAGPVIGTPPPYEAPITGAIPLYEYVSGDKRYITPNYYSSYPGYINNGILGFAFTTPVVGTTPLYRFVNSANGNHYYTIIDEGVMPDYVNHGIVCYVYPNQVLKSLPIYQHRTVNTNGVFHQYSNFAGLHEYYWFEDVKFYLLQNKQVTTYPLPDDEYAEVYCYYNNDIKDHYYTTVKQDNYGYVYEFILGYILRTQRSGTVPLYSYYKSKDDHYYTINKQNYPAYKYEGIVGYVYTTPEPGSVGIYSYYSGFAQDHYYHTLNKTVPAYDNEGIKFYMMKYEY